MAGRRLPGRYDCVIGYLGDSKAGLHLILNNIPTDTEDLQALYRAHVLPEPHLDEGRFLASQPGTHAGIDTSDGLSSDLGHITEESQVGATLYSDKIPVSESLLKFCSRFDYDPVEYALSGGEDYTLLCTIAPESAKETAAKFQAEFKKPLFVIGEINDSSHLEIIYPDGSSKAIAPTGWNHFKSG